MKNKIITLTFSLLLIIILLLNIMTPDQQLSYSERRELDLFPKLSLETIFNGEFMKKFEEYSLDQFVFREKFRQIKTKFEFDILNKKDVNDIYTFKDHLIKLEYPYNQKNVDHMVDYMTLVQEKYLKNANVYFSIIPDKNYFVTDNSYPRMDYERLESTLVNGLSEMTYINIFNQLELNDYYSLDTHWKQENLFQVLEKIGEVMEFSTDFSSVNYVKHRFNDFFGVYYGQATLDLPSDTLIYLESEAMKDVSIINYQYIDNESLQVYDTSKLGKMDSYDVFLSGSSPLIEITKSNAKTDKEIIIFRDSFGSSLAPLLLDEYSKITLIDTRYTSYETLDQFVEFSDQDVMFLYNSLVINNSQMLR